MTAEDARAVGMAGLPMGYDVLPHVTADYVTAHNHL
jgi:hypothetical protein